MRNIKVEKGLVLQTMYDCSAYLVEWTWVTRSSTVGFTEEGGSDKWIFRFFSRTTCREYDGKNILHTNALG